MLIPASSAIYKAPTAFRDRSRTAQLPLAGEKPSATTIDQSVRWRATSPGWRLRAGFGATAGTIAKLRTSLRNRRG